tara:strand:- start:1008 stop:1181 length:174 start_codon:yes stop_codon:yes gene_type:complete
MVSLSVKLSCSSDVGVLTKGLNTYEKYFKFGIIKLDKTKKNCLILFLGIGLLVFFCG